MPCLPSPDSLLYEGISSSWLPKNSPSCFKEILHGPDIVALCPLVLNQRNPLERHKGSGRCHQHGSTEDMFEGTWQAQGREGGFFKLHMIQGSKDTKGLQSHQSWGQLIPLDVSFLILRFIMYCTF